MNRNYFILPLALLCATSFIACGDDDEQQPTTPPVVIQPTEGTVTGWTSATHVPPEGGRSYFANFHSSGETATVAVTLADDNLLRLRYASDAWGTAEFADLTVEQRDGSYILPAGATTTITMQRGAYGGNGGGEYALTLLSGTVDKQLNTVSLVLSAYMSDSHGSYQLTFHPGEAEE